MNEMWSMVEWYWQSESDGIRKECVLLTLCRQIFHRSCRGIEPGSLRSTGGREFSHFVLKNFTATLVESSQGPWGQRREGISHFVLKTFTATLVESNQDPWGQGRERIFPLCPQKFNRNSRGIEPGSLRSRGKGIFPLCPQNFHRNSRGIEPGSFRSTGEEFFLSNGLAEAQNWPFTCTETLRICGSKPRLSRLASWFRVQRRTNPTNICLLLRSLSSHGHTGN
jgi:hypothetical protein